MISVKDGDHKAFSQLYDRYSNRLYAFFMKMLWNDSENSRDALQDLFMKIMDRSSLYKPEYQFKAWIFRIAANMCKNIYRKNAFEKEYKSQLIKEGMDLPNMDIKMDNDIKMDRLSIALKGLNEDNRSLFLMRYQQEMSIKELAETFDLAEGTVKSRLHYLRNDLSGKVMGKELK
jgi:RNA polymerase sigma-70 factor (ECF subfamily)